MRALLVTGALLTALGSWLLGDGAGSASTPYGLVFLVGGVLVLSGLPLLVAARRAAPRTVLVAVLATSTVLPALVGHAGASGPEDVPLCTRSDGSLAPCGAPDTTVPVPAVTSAS